MESEGVSFDAFHLVQNTGRRLLFLRTIQKRKPRRPVEDDAASFGRSQLPPVNLEVKRAALVLKQ